ncbi:N-6 DNA methylase [Nostoc sp. UIC 10607]|uniref:N-6 DNA methylase n=1 Tax=Nostoc sp. UIC 10607 TaxID=3045935 RepID=UPI0039A1F904
MMNISELESSLWEAADQLRANSKLTATEYSMPVLGLIFLRHATNRFEIVKAEIEKTLPSRGGKKRDLTKDDFTGKAAIFLPAEAHYDFILNLPDNADRGTAINTAMKLIENQSSMLQGVLPKEYTTFDKDLLRDLVRIFAREELRTATGDIFGRIYEYFLNKFAMSGAQEGGEFFTPPSLVRTIVNVIEPSKGIVFDPACGSAGMFVQTGYFVERSGDNPSEKITFYGQEKSETNTRLAKMNLAVHGLDGDIRLGNTFYDRREDLIGACHYVMSNPPFNVDGVSPEKVKGDARLFTEKKIPGISIKTKTVSNANYLWIQYFYSYLNETGRAGFVMASSASDAGHGEKEIRQEIIATGGVDVVIAIGTNFFYTRPLRCTLWFFDRGKPAERQNKTLMIDARSIHRVISRKVRDFSEEQLQNITAIVWLYRGEQDRYLNLVRGYLVETHHQASQIEQAVNGLDESVNALTQALTAFAAQLANTSTDAIQQTLFDDESVALINEDLQALQAVLAEQADAWTVLTDERQSLLADLKAHLAWFTTQAESLTSNDAQKACDEKFEPFVTRLKSIQKHINEVHKLTFRALDLAQKKLAANNPLLSL